MQVLIIALIFAIYVHDVSGLSGVQLAPLTTLIVFAAPKLFFVVVYGLFCTIVYRQLGTPSTAAGLKRLDWASNIYRLAILATFGLDLSIGCLVMIRSAIERLTGMPDPVLIDELVLLVFPLGMIVLGWATYYPIDRRLREATLIRKLDQGQPLYPIWTRGQYLVAQFRNQVGLILLPLLLLLAWTEIVFLYEWQWVTRLTGLEQPHFPVQLLGAAAIFMIAPLLITKIFDTVKLPNGPLRHRLVDMCRQHGVAIRQLLLWRTCGGMVNAAVLGIIAPLRFILVSDGLLESLPPEQVDAVMAHEIAHVRKHHMFWLLLCTIALLGLGDWLFQPIFEGLLTGQTGSGLEHETGLQAGIEWAAYASDPTFLASAATIIAWLVGFGWISRRFERQADCFAVLHLNQVVGGDDTERPQVIGADAVMTMVAALGNVARYNHIPIGRRSWRHGSIGWRQAYLKTLANKPYEVLPIDRVVMRIKLAALLGTVAWVVFIAMGAS